MKRDGLLEGFNAAVNGDYYTIRSFLGEEYALDYSIGFSRGMEIRYALGRM